MYPLTVLHVLVALSAQLDLKMSCLTHKCTVPLGRMPGGTAFQTMQLTSGSYIIVLKATLDDGSGEMHMPFMCVCMPIDMCWTREWCVCVVLACTEERHCVAFLSDLTMPTHPGFKGAIVDNDKRVSVRLLQPEDRTLEGSRKVFDQLFWTASEVRITSVWSVE